MTDYNLAEMRFLISDARPMRTPTDLRLGRMDKIVSAVWWILMLACWAVMVYGFVAL